MPMRDLSNMFYQPEAPKEGDPPVEYFYRELLRVSNALRLLAEGFNSVYTVAPPKPEDGMIVIADGTAWNPGAGAGAYERRAGAWVKL